LEAIMLEPGDPAPWFVAPTTKRASFHFNTAGGRYIALCFYGSAAHPLAQEALSLAVQNRQIFNDFTSCFFGVSSDESDFRTARVEQILPGIRHFLDRDGSIARSYRLPVDETGQLAADDGAWLILDPNLRVMATAPLARTQDVLGYLARLPAVDAHAGVSLHAPVLIAPRIFSLSLCRELILQYDEHGGEPSGFVRQVDGRTTLVEDASFKRRRDHRVTDLVPRDRARRSLRRRLFPEILKVFQFEATRIERYIVACYDSQSGGFFKPHRDNTTKGTAHRKFAVTINLNAEDFDGGELRFPEFGSRTYRAPTGGAVVFSCSLLHEATPVTRGRRYAFLPFLYDEQGAEVRQKNNKFLDESLSTYEPERPPQPNEARAGIE
jgi:predicted 2-oxoglutarate/Fe(II)-dependent dioxygenase YbiX/peroxiredoxin